MWMKSFQPVFKLILILFMYLYVVMLPITLLTYLLTPTHRHYEEVTGKTRQKQGKYRVRHTSGVIHRLYVSLKHRNTGYNKQNHYVTYTVSLVRNIKVKR